MNPVLTFSIGLALLILFFWYFATDQGFKKRLIATALLVMFVLFSVATIYPPKDKIAFGLDIQGGTSFLIRLVQPEQTEREITPAMLDQAVEVIRKRVDYFGGGEPVITPVGTDRILVQIPGLGADKIAEARTQLSRVAKLEFKIVYPDNGERLRAIDEGREVIPPDYRIETYTMRAEEGRQPQQERLLVRKKADLGGERVTSSAAYFGNEGWTVDLRFDSEGGKTFGDITEKHKGYRFAIVLDGEIQSAPVIRDAIYGGSAVITGRFTEEEARQLASVLENPLQTPVSIEEERSVSPTLGQDSIRSSVLAGVVGLLITMVCVLAYYRLLGLIANLVLIVNLLMLLGALTMFNFVLTLPGVAGIILTIGMAVDANVLIYERLREEMAMGKSLRASLEAGYDKAFSSIFDANVTTLITAIILFWMASGPVKGFAITLTLGIIASMFSVLIVARNASSWLVETNKVRKLSMMHLLPPVKFDWMRRGFMATMASIVVLVIAGSVFFMRGERNFGVDFRGGDLLTMSADRQLPLADLRRSLEPLRLADATIQESEQAGRAYITVRSAMGTSDAIAARLIEAFPDTGMRTEGAERVGPLVGRELARSSLIALGLGMLGILIYVTFRFELSFAIGAVVAVLHDVLMTIGLFALLDRELSLTLVGAILTIAGYSINDTIVVFDRIREGLTSGRRGSITEIMNDSISQTLSRTLLTGVTTLIPLVCLFLFGGTVLRDFALAIIIGILIGTYSSIFIASPIVLWWSKMRSGGGSGGAALRREVEESSAAPAKA
jgi:SecD/SecF fusion protein